MPIYEYECSECNWRFEKRQRFHDDTVADCPKCQSKSRRVMVPSPIIFKGSGFYVTDYAKNSSVGTSGVDSSTKKSGGTTSGDSSTKSSGGSTSGDSSTKSSGGPTSGNSSTSSKGK